MRLPLDIILVDIERAADGVFTAHLTIDGEPAELQFQFPPDYDPKRGGVTILKTDRRIDCRPPWKEIEWIVMRYHNGEHFELPMRIDPEDRWPSWAERVLPIPKAISITGLEPMEGDLCRLLLDIDGQPGQLVCHVEFEPTFTIVEYEEALDPRLEGTGYDLYIDDALRRAFDNGEVAFPIQVIPWHD